MLTEEETSTFPPQSPSSTTNPTFRPTFGSHEQPSFATSILANTTLDYDSQNEASMEYKEIPAKHETFCIDQDTFVTKQIHETMSDEDDQIMVSSNLITDEQQSKSLEDMDMIKQVATDFVKTLSQEALEIVKEKLSPVHQQGQFQLQVPNVAITFASEPDLSTLSDTHVESAAAAAEISDQFQFQTSFRAHFVRDFEYVTDDVDSTMNGQLEQTQEVSKQFPDTDGNNVDFQAKEKKEGGSDDAYSSHSGSHQMMESSEDIWAGEDSVMLRKSKTTFSMKSTKTDSESFSSDMKPKSDRHSGTDQEWSSSGDPYHTAHGSSSRPSSSDVDAMLSAVSDRGSSTTNTTTEYDTAHSHAESSQHSSSYHTAASTLSSRSFSDKSGHLASFEHSETSDTLIDISIEQEDKDTGICTPLGHEETILPHDDESLMGPIVRSPEMFFQDKCDTITGSIATISSASEAITTIIQQDTEAKKEIKEVKEEDVMVKSAVFTESTSSATSEKAIISCPTPHTDGGEILGSIEELKKDESPLGDKLATFQHHPITRVVSFDTSNLEITSPKSAGIRDQKSFDSEFGSRPESELKDFESRPHSISESMREDSFSRPESKGDVSESEMDHMKKNLDPFQRPGSPEPPVTDTSSPMDEKSVKTELAFSTHFTQVIEDEEYEKLDVVPEYQIMTAVEANEGTKQKLRGTHSFDLNESSASPPAINKPLSSGMVWPASGDLNLEDGENEPIGKRATTHSESDDEGMKTALVDTEDNWEEAVDPIAREPSTVEEGEFIGYSYNPPLDQIIEEEEEVHEESQLKEIQNLKESLSSTPEFGILADRRALNLKLGEKDDSSHSSLQEFEVLEQEMGQRGSGSGSESRNSLGSQDSLEMGGPVNKVVKKQPNNSKPCSSHGSSGSLQEFEQMEDACKAADTVDSKAKHQELVLSEIEEGHESQISESESCETLSQGGKSDDSAEFTQRMNQIDEIIRQAQSNVETFDQGTFDQQQQYLSCIMEASTDSLEATSHKKELIPSMVTSTDSLEDKFQHSSNGEDLMKISTDSIELGKNGKSSEASASAFMIASTDSLESGTTNTKVTTSMFSSYASHTSDTFVSDLDIKSGYESGLERLMESADESSTLSSLTQSACPPTTVTTSQCVVSYGFNVSEVIMPNEEGGLVSTIERTVEMPAEVTKIQFKGPDAEVKMQEYVQSIAGGKSLQEVESVDASGNVIHKRVIQQRLYPDEN